MDRAEIVELIGELRKELAGLPSPTPGPFWSVQEWTSLAQTIIDLEKLAEEYRSYKRNRATLAAWRLHAAYLGM